MTVLHRISLRPLPSQRQELESLGFKLPAGIVLPGGVGSPLVVFEVEENHPKWEALRKLVESWGGGDHVTTKFSRKDLEAAQWLDLAAWHHGYPQPDQDVSGYRDATYDLGDWCRTCGIGLKQKAPFQMKSEPRWGKNGILQLVWTYDEIFVKPAVWEHIFKPHGIGHREVRNTRGAELKTVVQLVIEEEVGIATDGLPSEACGTCGRVKYLPVTRGPFPPLLEQPTGAIARTRQYFGSGGGAHKRILVSQSVAHPLVTEELRGASLTPVATSR